MADLRIKNDSSRLLTEPWHKTTGNCCATQRKSFCHVLLMVNLGRLKNWLIDLMASQFSKSRLILMEGQ